MMITNIILKLLTSTLLSSLPKKLASKIYNFSDLEKDIEFRLRSANPVTFSVNREIPFLELWFEIINKSPYTHITSDRLIFEIWDYQPLFFGTYLMKHEIKSRESKDDIFIKLTLNKFQVEKIKNWPENQLININVLEADFCSKIGTVKKTIRLENIKPRIE
jgi:hypothetical protein